MPLSHFDERSGAVICSTPWGSWWQTVGEVFVEVKVPKGTRGKEVSITIQPNYLKCAVRGNVIFEGGLCRTVVADECTWTLEEQERIMILLAKSEPANAEKVWESLLAGHGYAPDPLVMHEMMKKLDLEKFQMEHPGFDFSGAKLDKAYEKIPGVEPSEGFQDIKLLEQAREATETSEGDGKTDCR